MKRLCNRNFNSGNAARYEATMLPSKDHHVLAVLADAASDDLQQYLAGVHYQRHTLVVVTLFPILLFVEYHDDGIFLLIRHPPPPPTTNDDIEQSPARGGTTIEVGFEQLNGDSIRSTAVPIDSRSVRQQADGACQLLQRGLNSQRSVLGSLVKAVNDVRVEL